MYSLDPIYQLLSSQAQIHANLYLAHAIGMSETLIFNTLIAKSTWYINNGLSEDGWFYCTQNDLQKSTTFGERTQRSAIKHLVDEGLIEYKVAGLPQKRFFRIVNDNESLSRLLKRGMEAYKEFDEEVSRKKMAINAEKSNSCKTQELNPAKCSDYSLRNAGINSCETQELITAKCRNSLLHNAGINHCETQEKNINNKNNTNKKNKEKISSASASQNPQTENVAATEEKNKTAYETIIAYLNEKAATRYKPTNSDTRKHINARLSEGYTVEDFLTVIDKKCSEWLGTEYQKYLTPSTLFGVKHFETYLNAPTAVKPENAVQNDESNRKYTRTAQELLRERINGGK